MLKGTTESGFQYEIEEESLDDWELLEIFRKLDKGNPQYVVDACEKLLGKTQYEQLKDHIRKEQRVSASAMMKEIEEIMQQNQETKNF